MTTSRIEVLIRQIEPEPNIGSLVNVDDLPRLQTYIAGADPYLAERATSLASLISAEDTIEVLRTALQSSYEQVRIAAANGLARIPSLPSETFVRTLQDESPSVRRFALRALGKRMTERDEVVPIEIAKAVKQSADTGLDAIISYAAQLLFARISEKVVDLELFRKVVRAGVPATDIGILLGPVGENILPTAAASSDSRNVAVAAVEAATVIGGETARRTFERAFGHPDSSVRRSVARGLQTRYDIAGHHKFVLPLLNDVATEVRTEAIVAATRTSNKDVEARVRKMAKRDGDLQVRDLARKAVSRSFRTPG